MTIWAISPRTLGNLGNLGIDTLRSLRIWVTSQAVRNIYEKYPEVREKIMDFKFPGRGQRKTG